MLIGTEQEETLVKALGNPISAKVPNPSCVLYQEFLQKVLPSCKPHITYFLLANFMN